MQPLAASHSQRQRGSTDKNDVELTATQRRRPRPVLRGLPTDWRSHKQKAHNFSEARTTAVDVNDGNPAPLPLPPNSDRQNEQLEGASGSTGGDRGAAKG